MRVFVSILLFLLFLLQSFSPFVMDAAYLLNKNYIAGNFCVNKASPQLHCDGKCYLAKQVAKDTKDSALPSGNKKDAGSDVYLPAVTTTSMAAAPARIGKIYVIVTATSLPGYHHSLLKPPQSFWV